MVESTSLVCVGYFTLYLRGDGFHGGNVTGQVSIRCHITTVAFDVDEMFCGGTKGSVLAVAFTLADVT